MAGKTKGTDKEGRRKRPEPPATGAIPGTKTTAKPASPPPAAASKPAPPAAASKPAPPAAASKPAPPAAARPVATAAAEDKPAASAEDKPAASAAGKPRAPEVTLAPPPAEEPKPKPLPPLAAAADIAQVVAAQHRDPFGFLGMHPLGADGTLVVRAFLPRAQAVSVVDAGSGRVVAALARLHDDGLYAGAIAGRSSPFAYRLRVESGDGVADVEDAYRFPPLLAAADAEALAKGTLVNSYEVLGAHPRTVDGVAGVGFAVWAPDAHRVAVVGDFNHWDGRCHGMRLRHEAGIWEIFVPGARAGQFYKFEIKADAGAPPLAKSDPYAFRQERGPGWASVICQPQVHRWQDRQWMAGRNRRNGRDAPIAVYQVHLGSWRRVPEEDARWLTYRELAEALPAYVKDLGFTHIELMPVSEFDFDGSLGYHPVSLYAPTGRFGSPDEFRLLVDRCHGEGIGVILDWVPVQFADEPSGLANFEGRPLYEHPDPLQRRHPRWHTLLYDYGRNEVANFLISNALYWLDQFHIDGLRVHGLASILYLDFDRGPGQWTRNRFGGHENLEAVEFIRACNKAVYGNHPDVLTIAEEASGWPMVSRPTFLGGLGFGFKWNAGWVDETLRYMIRSPIHRKYYHDELTRGPAYAFQENHILPLAHSEISQRWGPLLQRMPGSRWDRFANLRLYYALFYTQPGKKLMFMGGEFASVGEWSHERSLDWHLLDDPFHQGMQTLVRDLNRLYVGEPALHELDCEEGGFAWIDANDTDQSVISYLRQGRRKDDVAAVVANFTPVVRRGYRIGVPAGGFWEERFNSDSGRYGGSNVGNEGGVEAVAESTHGRPYSLNLTLPPYAVVVLRPAGEPKE